MSVLVIGAGAAGLMAAAAANLPGTVVLERNEKAGKKLYISGKGRCNLTNDCAPSDFVNSVIGGKKFILGAINRFSPSDTKELMESLGVPLKTERGGRVFPQSDKSSDVIRALTAHAEKCGARIVYGARVLKAKKTDGGFEVECDNAKYCCTRLIVATGGKSYPLTGSDGDGYKIARAMGHTVVAPVPSLVPILLSNNVSALAGLSLKNVTASVTAGGKTFSQFGEMLFTDSGVSGPIVLTLSAYVNRIPLDGATLSIDLKPALSEQTLDARVLGDFAKYANKQLCNALNDLMPRALIPLVIAGSGADGGQKVNTVSRATRTAIVHTIKNLGFAVKSLDSLDRAIVTAGGVATSEVNPKTMESKLCPGLFFAGEVLDVDALTGGFNIQIALSTGNAAGLGAATAV